MSVTRRIAFGAGASWFGRGVTIVLGLLILPVLFRHLPKEELGVWLLLGQSWVAMGILDLGVSVTLTRRIALAKGKSGPDPDAPLTPESLRDIADLVASGRRIYYVMAGGVFLVSWIAGFFYLRNLHLHNLSHATVWIAWTILCASQALNLLAVVWDCLLLGVGYVGWDALVASFISAMTLAAQIIAVLLGGRLIALASIATAGALSSRFITRWLARRRRPELFRLRGRWNREVLRGLPHTAFRAWLTALGTALVFNSDQFFIAASRGAENIPAFRAAYILVHNITVLAVTFGLASSVFVSHYWQAGDLAAVRRLVERNARLGLLIMLCACAFLLTVAQGLFELWLGPGNFIGYRILAVFLAYETFEAHSYIISTSSRATDDEAFGFSSLAAGLLKIGLAFALLNRFGLLGLALATMLALLLTNHWYAVYRGLKRLQLPLFRYGKDVVVPSLLWALAALLLANAASRLLNDFPAVLRIIGAAGATGAVFFSAFACFVLTQQERKSLKDRFSALVLRLLPAR
ncbi:MAG: lipopolysaccharide biosynthesis protein [Chthoniobacterales bacterium]|nr:lipopolysaccharide biosynthesis protein [Chthoniobacterales bacterium]